MYTKYKSRIQDAMKTTNLFGKKWEKLHPAPKGFGIRMIGFLEPQAQRADLRQRFEQRPKLIRQETGDILGGRSERHIKHFEWSRAQK